tara:strand:+ start:658 stop:1044 length:387 start_codon:yes stop_codon:yes gene_type:complete
MNYKKAVKAMLVAYNKQIKKDMGFWIKYRPSRWGDLLPGKFIRPFLNFIGKKGGKKLAIKSALIFSLIFIGVIPTLSFVWSNIFRLWLILIFIPMIYWSLAIFFVYIKVIYSAISELIIVLIDKLFHH